MEPLCITGLEYGLYDQEIQSFAQFLPQIDVFSTTEGKLLRILSRILNFFKTQKNLYTQPLCVIDLEFGLYDQEIRSFIQFLPQTDAFRKNRMLTLSDFEPKFDFLTHKNLYTGPLCVTDLEFELYDQEIRNFSQFCHKQSYFGRTER
jgi:hypothetical protein